MADACRELGSVFGCEGFGPGQSCFQAADSGRRDIEVIRDNETMMRVVAVFVEGGRSEAQRPVTTARAARSGRRRLARPVARWRVR